jgi:hypothetical protein
VRCPVLGTPQIHPRAQGLAGSRFSARSARASPGFDLITRTAFGVFRVPAEHSEEKDKARQCSVLTPIPLSRSSFSSARFISQRAGRFSLLGLLSLSRPGFSCRYTSAAGSRWSGVGRCDAFCPCCFFASRFFAAGLSSRRSLGLTCSPRFQLPRVRALPGLILVATRAGVALAHPRW